MGLRDWGFVGCDDRRASWCTVLSTDARRVRGRLLGGMRHTIVHAPIHVRDPSGAC
mgnify:CR=1 FL=1